MSASWRQRKIDLKRVLQASGAWREFLQERTRLYGEGKEVQEAWELAAQKVLAKQPPTANDFPAWGER